MAGHADTKTIDQFLAENPNVDVTPYWERCWKILSGVKERIAERFPDLEREENTKDRDYYTSPNGEWEGSMKAWSGPGMEWLVNSWLGNRQASILDMNATAFLGQETDVPHLVIVFGTIPNLFFYADYTPRRDLMENVDYLDRYYGDDVNQWYLGLRGHENFQWSVSHGNYMRALTNPVNAKPHGRTQSRQHRHSREVRRRDGHALVRLDRLQHNRFPKRSARLCNNAITQSAKWDTRATR